MKHILVCSQGHESDCDPVEYGHVVECIGDIRTLKHDISAMKGTILAGSRVKIIGSSFRGWDIQDLESGEVIYESMDWDIFEKE